MINTTYIDVNAYDAEYYTYNQMQLLNYVSLERVILVKTHTNYPSFQPYRTVYMYVPHHRYRWIHTIAYGGTYYLAYGNHRIARFATDPVNLTTCTKVSGILLA